jgi:hypothetical protein
MSSFRAKGLAAATALALASGASANPQGGNQPQGAPAKAAEASGAFDRACMDLVQGKAPKDAQAIDALRDACAKLMKARSEDERRRAEARQHQLQLQEQLRQQQAEARIQQQAKVQPGKSAAAVPAGESVPTAFEQAGSELMGATPRGLMGYRRNGEPFQNTVSTNVVGWFTGVGVNAELTHSFMREFSWIGGAHYSQSAATSNSIYTLGFGAGADWFIIGRNNAGLRVGPRLDYSFGREEAGGPTKSRLGLTGEVGYNFLASNGITGSAAFGLGGRIAGDANSQLSSGAGGEFGPYVKLQAGFSW